MEQAITCFAIAVTAIVLLSASVYDWRYREIPDWHWVILFLLSMVLSTVTVMEESTGIIGILMPICIAVIAFDCLFDRDSSFLFDSGLKTAFWRGIMTKKEKSDGGVLWRRASDLRRAYTLPI